LVQIVHDRTERAAHLKDMHPTYDVCYYPDRRAGERTA
jgi:hypothetical protein